MFFSLNILRIQNHFGTKRIETLIFVFHDLLAQNFVGSKICSSILDLFFVNFKKRYQSGILIMFLGARAPLGLLKQKSLEMVRSCLYC